MNGASGRPPTLQRVGDADAAFCDPDSREACALSPTASIEDTLDADATSDHASESVTVMTIDEMTPLRGIAPPGAARTNSSSRRKTPTVKEPS